MAVDAAHAESQSLPGPYPRRVSFTEGAAMVQAWAWTLRLTS